LSAHIFIFIFIFLNDKAQNALAAQCGAVWQANTIKCYADAI